MQSIISSYLLQSGECSLAQIGTFTVSTKPAEPDFVHKQILPPTSEIVFIEGSEENSLGLIKYVAQKKGFSDDLAENILNNFCSEWRERLEDGDTLLFPAVGSLNKATGNKLLFTPEKTVSFLKAVSAERVLHEDVEHTTPAEDKDDATPIVAEYKSEEAVTRSRWWVWAALLALIALAVIVYHFSSHTFPSSSSGNQTRIVIDSAGATHSELPAN